MQGLVRILGPGRAGRSLAGALGACGIDVEVLDRNASAGPAAQGCAMLVIATPDRVVEEVANAVKPVDDTVVVHLAGALGLDVLARHPRRGSLHPLVAMPDPAVGADRLRGAWFAVSGDDAVGEVVALLDGTPIHVADEDRTAYHAAAVVASNHLVAVLGQAERLAATAGVPLAALLDLVRSTVDNVAELGPAAALTGPVARGDWETVSRHLADMPADERPAYALLANEARKLTRAPAPAPARGEGPDAKNIGAREGDR